MAKIQPITEKEFIQAVNNEGLGAGHPFESGFDMGRHDKAYRRSQAPGTIGVTQDAAKTKWMSYMVDTKGFMHSFTHHRTPEEAYGMALERYRACARDPEYVKSDGPSFAYGPLTQPAGPPAAECKHQERFYKRQANWKGASFYGSTVRLPRKGCQGLSDLFPYTIAARNMEDILKEWNPSVHGVSITLKNDEACVKFKTYGHARVEPAMEKLCQCMDAMLEETRKRQAGLLGQADRPLVTERDLEGLWAGGPGMGR